MFILCFCENYDFTSLKNPLTQRRGQVQNYALGSPEEEKGLLSAINTVFYWTPADHLWIQPYMFLLYESLYFFKWYKVQLMATSLLNIF